MSCGLSDIFISLEPQCILGERTKASTFIISTMLILTGCLPPVGISPENSDGPTFPLEVSTDRYYYPPGVDIDIILANVGEKHIIFDPTPVNLYIVDSISQVVVDTTLCPKPNAEVRIYNVFNYLYSMEWDERYLICDENGDLIPPSGEEVPLGVYTISAGSDSARYGDDPMPIWDSVSIEIGSENPIPVADAGPDQTVYAGDVVQFDGSGSSDPNAGWNRVTVDANGTVGAWASLALDKQGDPHISYIDGTSGSLKYANLTGDDWTIEVLDSDGVGGSSTSIALDQVGRPHISYYANGNLRHANWTGTEWHIDTVDADGDVGMYSSLALDSLGYPHISYYENYNYPRISNLKYARWNGTDWNFETVDEDGAVGTYSSIALNKSDSPHISFHELSWSYDLKYARRIGGKWIVETVDSEGETGLWTSLALDKRGDPHIGYYRSDFNQVKYAKQTWNTWHFEIVDEDLWVGGGMDSLVLDTWDNPHMAYYDSYQSEGAGLKYSERTKDGWRHEFVDLGFTTYASLSLDAHDAPHIGYLEADRGDLKYATLSDRIIEYYWDFGDGSPHRTGLTPTHVYSNPGVYNVTLKVTDTYGGVDTDNCIITVLERPNQPPVADADGPYFADEGHSIQLDGSGSYDPDNDTLQYRWDLDNDGIWDTNWSLNPTTMNTWMDDGTYTIVLQVMDTSNETSSNSGVVSVSDQGPSAEFVWSPEPQYEGSPVLFTDKTNSYPDAVTSWLWEFEDGGNATGQNVTHTYGDNGFYMVTLTVVDDDGSKDAVTHNLTILNVAPVAHAGEDKEGSEVSTFSFNGSCTDPGILDTFTYEWDFDYDGLTFSADMTGQSVSYTWIDDFDGIVALRVIDDDGGMGIDTVRVLVKNVQPEVVLEILPVDVDVSLRIAGEKWHDVSLELYENDVLIAQGNLTRYPGSPNDQMLSLTHLSVNISRNYSAIVRYTPEDDPINGQPNGANPCWIILTFGDGKELRLHHNFNVNHPDRYIWEVDLMAMILSRGLTFEATAYDPGADDLTFHWDFGDGTNATSFYPNANDTFPIQITDTITHVFPVGGTYIITVTVIDDDGGVGVAKVQLVVP